MRRRITCLQAQVYIVLLVLFAFKFAPQIRPTTAASSPTTFSKCINDKTLKLVQQMQLAPPSLMPEISLGHLAKRVRGELSRGGFHSRVVILVWFGRSKYAEILKPYLLRETNLYGGVADEIWLSMSTSSTEDYALGVKWSQSYPDTIKLLCSHKEQGCREGRHDAEVWEELLQPHRDTLFVRIDDDVVFVEQGAVTHLVAHKLFHDNASFRLHGIAIGNVVNHCQLPHLHEAIGALELPASESFGYYDASWTNAKLAHAQHLSFLTHYNADTLHKYHYPTWDMNACACDGLQPWLDVCNSGWYRWCMNFFVVSGHSIQNETIAVFPDKREESWISAHVPKKYGVHSESVGRALAVHFSYGMQRRKDGMSSSEDLFLRIYKNISRVAATKLDPGLKAK